MTRCYELGHSTLIQLRGKDRCRILNNVCTQDLRMLAHGQSTETFVTDVKGRTVGHGVVFGVHETIYFLTVPNQADRIVPHLDRYVIREDVTIQSLGEAYQLWLFSGASIQRSTLLGTSVSDATALQAGILEWKEHSGFWTRAPWIGDNSLVVLMPAGADRSFLQTSSGIEIVASDLHRRTEWELDRIQAFWPWYGVDLDDKNLPQEIDRNKSAISFKKGCYLGQETIARLDALGQVQKKLVRLRIQGNIVLASQAKIFAGENEAGWICSSAYCDETGCTVAMGYVKRAYFGTSQELQVNGLPVSIL